MTQATPNARAIIAQAIASDAEGFRALLIKQAEAHDDHMEFTRHAGARAGAKASFNACLAAYNWIGLDDLLPEDRALAITSESAGVMVIALNEACRLLGLPAHIRTQAAMNSGGES